MEIIKVKNSTTPKMLGYSVAQMVKEEKKEIAIQAVGAGAINQAMKGVVEANKYLASSAITLKIIPAFCDIEEGGNRISGMRFYVLQ